MREIDNACFVLLDSMFCWIACFVLFIVLFIYIVLLFILLFLCFIVLFILLEYPRFSDDLAIAKDGTDTFSEVQNAGRLR